MSRISKELNKFIMIGCVLRKKKTDKKTLKLSFRQLGLYIVAMCKIINSLQYMWNGSRCSHALNAAACSMTETNQNLELQETRKRKEETL